MYAASPAARVLRGERALGVGRAKLRVGLLPAVRRAHHVESDRLGACVCVRSFDAVEGHRLVAAGPSLRRHGLVNARRFRARRRAGGRRCRADSPGSPTAGISGRCSSQLVVGIGAANLVGAVLVGRWERAHGCRVVIGYGSGDPLTPAADRLAPRRSRRATRHHRPPRASVELSRLSGDNRSLARIGEPRGHLGAGQLRTPQVEREQHGRAIPPR